MISKEVEMIYRGRVVKGAILLETGVAFPEGAEIRIEVIDPVAPPAEDRKDDSPAHDRPRQQRLDAG